MLVIALQAAGSLPGNAETASKLHQANVLGFAKRSADPGKKGLPATIDPAAVYALAKNPLVASYQEICISQYNKLGDMVGGNGYTLRFLNNIGPTYAAELAEEQSAAWTRCGGSLGVATMTKFYLGAGNVKNLHYAASSQDTTNDKAKRGYVCMKAGVYLRAWTVCGTHITTGGMVYKAAQTNGLFNLLYTWGSGYRILLGDLNMTPSNVIAQTGAYGSYDEVDEASGKNTMRNADCGGAIASPKIDYGFVRYLDGLSTIGYSNLYEICSDHSLVEGFFYFND